MIEQASYNFLLLNAILAFNENGPFFTLKTTWKKTIEVVKIAKAVTLELAHEKKKRVLFDICSCEDVFRTSADS